MPSKKNKNMKCEKSKNRENEGPPEAPRQAETGCTLVLVEMEVELPNVSERKKEGA